MNALRKGLPSVPRRMRHLPIESRGYPVPWFVAWIDGKPDFRVIGPYRLAEALNDKRCWLCGGLLGRYKTFVIGPMCAVTRTTSEPPCHKDCAEFAAIACPFMTLPKAQYRSAGLPDNAKASAGIPLRRNPGAVCLWTSTTFLPFRVPGDSGSNPGVLITVGDPESVEWYAEGATATRQQIMDSIDGGLPSLWTSAQMDGIDGMVAFENYVARALSYLPAA